MVYGSYPINAMTYDSNTGTYVKKIDISSYGLTEPVWGCATACYPSGVVTANVHEITSTYIKIGCEINISRCYIDWMVIG